MASTYERFTVLSEQGWDFPFHVALGRMVDVGSHPEIFRCWNWRQVALSMRCAGAEPVGGQYAGSATLQRLSKSTFTTLGDPGPVAPCISREPERALPEGRNHRHGQLQTRQAGRWLRLELDLRRPGSPRQRGSNGSLHPDRALGLLEPTSPDAAGQRNGSPALPRARAIHVLAPGRSRETSSTNRPLPQRES